VLLRPDIDRAWDTGAVGYTSAPYILTHRMGQMAADVLSHTL